MASTLQLAIAFRRQHSPFYGSVSMITASAALTDSPEADHIDSIVGGQTNTQIHRYTKIVSSCMLVAEEAISRIFPESNTH